MGGILRFGAFAVLVIAVALSGLYFSYSPALQSPSNVAMETHAADSNFTERAHEEWSNGSSYLLLPGGSIGNGVAVGDVNGDSKMDIVTISDDTDWSGLSYKEQASLRIWDYDGSSLSLLAEKVWGSDGKNPAGNKVVKIFSSGGSTYIITGGMEKYGHSAGKGGIRIWKYASGISLISNVTWRDYPDKNTTVEDLFVDDVDGDGNLEVIAVGNIKWSTDNNTKNYSMAEITAWRIEGDMSLNFVAKYIWHDDENNTYANSVDGVDYDGDGYCDIVVGGSYGFNDSGVLRSKAQLTVFNLRGGAFINLRHVEWIDNDNCGVMDLLIRDVDRDGKDEIVAAGANKYFSTAGEVSVWSYELQNLARAQFYIDPEGQPGSSHWDCLGLSLVVDDFDMDGDNDIVITGLSKGPHSGGDTFWAYLIAFHYSSSTLTQGSKIYWRAYDGEVMQSLASGDIDGDGTPDIVSFGYGWKSDSSGGMTYYAMLYIYDYQQNVPELNQEFLILLPILVVFILRRANL